MGIESCLGGNAVFARFVVIDKIIHRYEAVQTPPLVQSESEACPQCESPESDGEPTGGERRRQGSRGRCLAPEPTGWRHGRIRRRSACPLLQRMCHSSICVSVLMPDRRAHESDAIDDTSPLVTAHQVDLPPVRLKLAPRRNEALLLHVRPPLRALYTLPAESVRLGRHAVHAQLSHQALVLAGRIDAGRRGTARSSVHPRLERDRRGRGDCGSEVRSRRISGGYDVEPGFAGTECTGRP